MTKAELIGLVEAFGGQLRKLRRDVKASETPRIGKKALLKTADELATTWVEELRSPLEHRVKLPSHLVDEMSEYMKELHRLSRPNSAKSSYVKALNAALLGFDDRFIVPIKQASALEQAGRNLKQLVPALPDADESDYLEEAVACANAGYFRAAIVMGWCAAINRIQRKILAIGLEAFNRTSANLKNQTSGKFKRFNKEFKISTLGELQTVFDTDLVHILEGMQLIDSNQAQRLHTCFQYRCHSGHPGEAPIEEPHLVAFFSDVSNIILTNDAFRL
jgi:hypothetical protein